MDRYIPSCPACGSYKISEIQDYERNLGILKCDECGEMYAYRKEDLWNYGEKIIIREWWASYKHTKRLEGR